LSRQFRHLAAIAEPRHRRADHCTLGTRKRHVRPGEIEKDRTFSDTLAVPSRDRDVVTHYGQLSLKRSADYSVAADDENAQGHLFR
jgi:hypothetical protein